MTRAILSIIHQQRKTYKFHIRTRWKDWILYAFLDLIKFKIFDFTFHCDQDNACAQIHKLMYWQYNNTANTLALWLLQNHQQEMLLKYCGCHGSPAECCGSDSELGHRSTPPQHPIYPDIFPKPWTGRSAATLASVKRLFSVGFS